MTALIVRGDALSLPLRGNSVDLIVTSPPYLWKRKYAIDGAGEMGNERDWRAYLHHLFIATGEMLRVLKRTGSIFVNLGDTRVTGTEPKWLGIPIKSKLLLPERYRVGCQDRFAPQGVIVRQVQVWEKENGLPESVTDRTRDSHEDWVHLTKSPRYFAALDELREPYAPSSYAPNKVGRSAMRGRAQMPGRQDEPGYTPGWEPSPLGALPGSVWSIPSEPLRLPPWVDTQHYAAFPTEWPRRLILGFTPHLICQVCGIGRFPIVDRQQQPNPQPIPGDGIHHRSGGNGAHSREAGSASIVGYGCGCTPFTDHPGTGEPSGPSYAAALADGGYVRAAEDLTGYGRTSLTNRPKVGPWREYHLDQWTPPPGHPATVLDPFGGTGTVAHVARALGRHAITIDLSEAYCRLATDQTLARQRAAKVLGRVHLERQGTLL